jgi:hypothetical protein
MLSTPQQITRRWFFKDCGVGLGSAALYLPLQGAKAVPPLRRTHRWLHLNETMTKE